VGLLSGTGVLGELVEPAAPGPVPLVAAVLVLAGSSGRVDVDRARLLAQHGALALALRWFGGDDQPPGICEVPIETFTRALDLLQQRAPGARLGIVGISKAAEAALLTASLDDRVDAVVALAPSHVVWANVGPGPDGATYPYRSSWAWRGEPLPFVPYDESWQPGPPPVAHAELYRRSVAADPMATAAAIIDANAARADLLLVAGRDDRMWPALDHALVIEGARRAAGRQVELVSAPDAGHRILFPGEPDLPPSGAYQYGGSPGADRALGALAWPRVVELLGLVAPGRAA
jgi:uncharacterized protein